MTNKMSPEEIAEMSEDCQCSCKELDRMRTLCEVAYGIWSRNQGPESEAADRMADILNEILQGSPHAHEPGAVECKDCEQLIGERDRAQDALQETHIALGGDGGWVGRLPPCPAPYSGDLHLDVPELARDVMRDAARYRWLRTNVNSGVTVLFDPKDGAHGKEGLDYNDSDCDIAVDRLMVASGLNGESNAQKAPFGTCPDCQEPITSFHNINGCPARKSEEQP